MTRSLAAVAVLVAAAVVLAGCVSADDLTPADIPASERPTGWTLDSERTEKGEINVGPITVAAFAKQVYNHDAQPQGVVAVVTVTDVPLADVQGRIRDEFDKTLQSQGVQRTERRSGQMQVDGQTADYTLYDAQVDQAGASVKGFVLEYTYSCGEAGNVAGFLGLAGTEVQTRFGGGSDASTWHDVAGSDWENEFGGMSKAVTCTP